ncbi:MAG: hypothetical protein JNK21_03485 [Rhodospirillaceae bacterium]|nr:hypothetical protein [Rhodospirillaceae bacterium]
MPITLITGTPGAGKTLRAVERLRAAVGSRPVYVCGIEGLTIPGVLPLADPHTWADLPDGSLVVVDEAWRHYPRNKPGTPPIPPVANLAEHRHRGFDFIIVTQGPTQIDTFVRSLVSEHEHVSRRFGTHHASVWRWGAAVTDVNGSGERAKALQVEWRYPKDVFELYKSASLHTVKRRIPFRVLLFPVLAVAVLGTLGYWILRDPAEAAAVKEEQRTPVALPGTVAPSPQGKRSYATPEEWIAAHTPRVPTMPWSAPIYDGLSPSELPIPMCVINHDKGTCICRTEQGTRYDLPGSICRRIAFEGLYNPYKRATPSRG